MSGTGDPAAGPLRPLVWGTGAVLLTVLVIYLTTVIPTWITGTLLERTPSELSILRDLAWAGLMGLTVLALLRLRASLPLPGILVAFLGSLGVLIGIAVVTHQRMGLPDALIPYGLRFLQFLPVAVLWWWIARHIGRPALLRLGVFVRIVVVVQAAVAIPQIFTMAPVFGTTVFGSRPFGTLPLPHHFGMLMGLLCLWFYVERGRGAASWALACTALCATSGSRLGMLLAMAVLGWWALDNLRQPLLKPVALLIVPLLGWLVFGLLSSEAVSGRADIGDSTADRAYHLGIAVDRLAADPARAFTGFGLGLGSSGAVFIAETGGIPKDRLQLGDNTLVVMIVNFGLPGMLLYLAALIAVWLRGRRGGAGIVAAVTLGMSLSFSIWELFPINLLLAVLLGWCCHRPAEEPADA